MASIINEVIKDAIKEANTRQLVLTPDNYMNVFCDIAKKKGVIVEDCQKLSKFISKLDPSYQTQLSKMNVNTIDELFAFITSRLNRQSSVDITKVFILLTKRILQSISLLHNKEARNLANISLETIDKRVSVENLEIIKDKWFDFLSNYDDSYLKHLEMYGVKQSDDLQKIINTILNSKISEQEDPELASLADLMIAALVPSIASSMNDELAAICEEIKAKPELLQSKAMQGDIKKIILKRVELDKGEFAQKIAILDDILNGINDKILYFISIFKKNQADVRNIKNDIAQMGANADYTLVKNKLLNIADTLDLEITDFVSKLLNNEKTIKELNERIQDLENRLNQANQEICNDFLTGVGTKRAFESELIRIEEAYKRYGVEYCICFFDIDHFKNVNDSYGHEAGDKVLSVVGRILKKYSRGFDFIARYGGEEFVAILPKTSKEGAVSFANKILRSISGYKFMYKDQEINLTISCGISSRQDNASDTETLTKSDEMLYLAKNSGRNCIKA